MKKIIKNWIDNYVLVHLDKLLNRPNIKNGLQSISLSQIKKAGDYIFGLLGETNKRPIKQDGNFESYLSRGEQQNEGFERLWCVSENGICNQIETVFNYYADLVNQGQADEIIQELIKIFKYFGLIKDNKCLLDTAYVAVGSGTTRRGNSYTTVADFIRHYGLIPKGLFPYYMTWNELYYSKAKNSIWINGNKMPAHLIEQGKKLVNFIDITYEWIPPTNFDEAIEMGSFGVSAFAWPSEDANGIYQNVNLPANHSILKFCKNESQYKRIADSYPPFIKKLGLSYNLGYGFLLSFGLKKKLTVFNEQAIRDFKKRKGWDYILLVESYKEFNFGLYRINDGQLEKMETPQAVKEWINEMKKIGKLGGINSQDFSKLIV